MLISATALCCVPKPSKKVIKMAPPALIPPLTDAERTAKKVVVCLTGATSYVGSQIAYRLLAAGHTVHAPVRKPDDPEKVNYLKELPNAETNMKLFKGDLLQVSHACRIHATLK